MENKIIYCDECGEYLGELVKGVLYKPGKVIFEPHQCQKKSVLTGKMEDKDLREKIFEELYKRFVLYDKDTDEFHLASKDWQALKKQEGI